MARGVSGVIAIRVPGETGLVYGAGGAPTHRLRAFGVGSSLRSKNNDGTDEANGYEGPLSVQRLAKMPKLAFRSAAHDTTLPLLMAQNFGLDTVSTPTGATAARRHKIVPTAVATTLPSTSLEFHHVDAATTTVQKTMRWRGAVSNQVTLRGDTRSGRIEVGADYEASGKYEAGMDVSSLIAPTYGPYKMNNIFCGWGTAYTPLATDLVAGAAPSMAEITGVVPLYLRNFEFTSNNNISADDSHVASIDDEAIDMDRGRKIMRISLTMKFAEATATVLNFVDGDGSINGTLGLYCVSNTKIEDVTTDTPYAWIMACPLVYQDGEATFGEDTPLGVRTITVPLLICENTTQNWAEFYAYNKDVSDYI